MSREFPKNFKVNSVEIPTSPEGWSDLLWEKAADLAESRKAITSVVNAIFEELGNKGKNMHPRDKVDRENEYWQYMKQLDEVKKEEQALEDALVEVGSGTVLEEKLMELLDIPKKQTEEKLSKKKRKEREFYERLMNDPRMRDAIDLGIVPPLRRSRWRGFGGYSEAPQTTHLTTGRHATDVKNLGTVTPEQAEEEFYYKTADTHGGKVDYGKKTRKKR